VKNDKLFWTNQKGELREVILSFEERRKILEGKHDENGHFGREKTLGYFRQVFLEKYLR
jgi:hypothetical protein